MANVQTLGNMDCCKCPKIRVFSGSGQVDCAGYDINTGALIWVAENTKTAHIQGGYVWTPAYSDYTKIDANGVQTIVDASSQKIQRETKYYGRTTDGSFFSVSEDTTVGYQQIADYSSGTHAFPVTALTGTPEMAPGYLFFGLYDRTYFLDQSSTLNPVVFSGGSAGQYQYSGGSTSYVGTAPDSSLGGREIDIGGYTWTCTGATVDLVIKQGATTIDTIAITGRLRCWRFYDGKIYIVSDVSGSPNSVHVYQYEPDGTENWHYTDQGRTDFPGTSTFNFDVWDGLALIQYFAGHSGTPVYDDRMACIDVSTGSTVWRVTAGQMPRGTLILHPEAGQVVSSVMNNSTRASLQIIDTTPV